MNENANEETSASVTRREFMKGSAAVAAGAFAARQLGVARSAHVTAAMS
jgi:secreted PhoX family phosphatase